MPWEKPYVSVKTTDDDLKPIGEIIRRERGGPLGDIADASSPQVQHHFTRLDQVHQLIEASEEDADMGFMARLMVLCSLPRTNLGDRLLLRSHYQRHDLGENNYRPDLGGAFLPQTFRYSAHHRVSSLGMKFELWRLDKDGRVVPSPLVDVVISDVQRFFDVPLSLPPRHVDHNSNAVHHAATSDFPRQLDLWAD